MLTDNEVKLQSEDSLRYKTLCDTLSGIVLNSQTPITIGVFGEWGSGKTSLMRLTENDLKIKNTKTVWFNAWKFDKAQDLRIALIHSILKEIENDKTATKKLKDKAVGLLKRVNWLGLGRTAVTVGASLATPYLAILPLLSQVFSDSKKGSENLSKILPDELLKDQSEGKTLELIGEFEEEFKKLAMEYTGKDSRLVVFIDDLDRCLPEKALDILESIKLFLNVPQTVFVIGTDVKVIENGLKQKYDEKSDELAKNYLDKIIQVPFRIPPLSKKDIIDHFIPSLQIADEIKEYAFIIADAGNNPRTVKRLLNNIELQKILSKTRDIVIEDIILVKLNVLEFRWKEFHSDMIEIYSGKNENLLKIMDEYEHADEIKKEAILKNHPVLKKHIQDYELTDFLNKEPSLDNIEIAPYIHLQKTTAAGSVSADEFGGDVDKYFQLGYAKYEEKDFIKAIDYYTRCITLNPNYKQAYFNRGLACKALNQHKRAINDFIKAIEIDKEYTYAYYNLGNCYSNINEHENAVKYYSKALEIDPGYVDAYYQRALSYFDLKNFEEAIKDNSKIIELDPGYFPAYYGRAINYLDLKDYDKSIADNSKAIELKPDYTDAYINRGLSYNNKKNYQAALTDYVSAINISPEYELANNNFLSLINYCILNKDAEKIKLNVEPSVEILKKSKLSEEAKNKYIELLNNFRE
ncbi:MAG: tetratricopeptide repeat protein [Ignavibacteriae bacterium]|nr:tetratricopeptide repeat protein [Ignavibacteriota bacterium]